MDMRETFARRQEAVRKDIECSFGIVVARFHVLKRPLRNWYLKSVRELIYCCVILHNMIVVERTGTVGEEVVGGCCYI
jgi:Plant transposon protein